MIRPVAVTPLAADAPATRARYGRGPGQAMGQPAVTGAGFSIGTPIMLPYSVHEPS
jgi:hypothetical protein